MPASATPLMPTCVPPDVAQVRVLVAATVAALKQLPTIAHQAANAELVSVVGELDELAALGTAGLVTMTAEAEQRGVISESQCASTAAWVRDAAWHLQTGGSVVVAKCVAILRRHDLTMLAEAIQTTDITPNVAATVAAEFDKIAPDLADGAGPPVLDAMIGIGADHGPRSVKQLRQQLLAQYGRDGAFQHEQDSKHRQVDLSAGRELDGVFHYELTLDAEGRAVLEAAIGPLSKPHPESDGGPDLRPFGRRRGEALIEVCRRATAAGCQFPSAAKASLYVTMSYNELLNAIGAATTIGSLDGGSLLAPETVRKLACDAQIIPIVLGSDGEILDEGRAQRLFTAAQLKALWLRDKHCTFPACETPAHWSDAHHLRHWIDGGPTDLDNAALLCGRHHTIVHRDQLAGTLVDGQVLWDRRPGSYQRSATTSGA
ncbi:MAG: HNH endonuclease [Actinomycetota bacterium]|nr:HNH endonuclease [Actinomycetota bacterium]